MEADEQRLTGLRELKTAEVPDTRAGRKMDYRAEYNRWIENVKEEDLLQELRSMDDADIEDALYELRTTVKE